MRAFPRGAGRPNWVHASINSSKPPWLDRRIIYGDSCARFPMKKSSSTFATDAGAQKSSFPFKAHRVLVSIKIPARIVISKHVDLVSCATFLPLSASETREENFSFATFLLNPINSISFFFGASRSSPIVTRHSAELYFLLTSSVNYQSHRG